MYLKRCIFEFVMETRQLLYEPLKKLEFTEGFIRQGNTMGFESLEDILSCPPAELIHKKGFSYGWLEELTRFLNEKGLLHLLQSSPGRSSG
jgi:hypothetical protein